MAMKASFAIAVFFAFTFFAHAARATEEIQRRATSSSGSSGSGSKDGRAPTIYVEAGTGIAGVRSTEFLKAPRGGQFLVGGGVTFGLARHWGLSTGLAWMYSHMASQNEGRNFRMRTRSGWAELNPRYSFTERFQAGPALSLAFGADTSFAPRVGDNIGTVFGGFKLFYALPVNGEMLKLWQHTAIDLSSPGRQIILAMAGIQISFPVRLPSRQSDEITVAQAAPNEVRVVLDAQKVFFRTNSSRLKNDVARALRDLGAYLMIAPESCGSILVTGHADRRGSFEYNLKLSEKRAASVRKAILEGGSDESAISSSGMSFSLPLDPAQSPRAWAKNRRVELVFSGVDDPVALKKRLEPLTKLAPQE